MKVITSVDDAVATVGEDTVNLTLRHIVEIDGVEKPAAVAESIARFVF